MDVTKRSFDAANRYFEVIFQRGRDLQDFELNELQENFRFWLSMLARKTSGDWASDAIVITGHATDEEVSIASFWCSPQGLILQTTLTVVEGITMNVDVAPAVWTIVLKVNETEVADENQTPQLGETTKRKQLQHEFLLIEPDGVIPTSTVASIVEDGLFYVVIAEITRPQDQLAIEAVDIVVSSDLALGFQVFPDLFLNKLMSGPDGDELVMADNKAGSPYPLAEGTVKSQLTEVLAGLNDLAADTTASGGAASARLDAVEADVAGLAVVDAGFAALLSDHGDRLDHIEEGGNVGGGNPYTMNADERVLIANVGGGSVRLPPTSGGGAVPLGWWCLIIGSISGTVVIQTNAGATITCNGVGSLILGIEKCMIVAWNGTNWIGST